MLLFFVCFTWLFIVHENLCTNLHGYKMAKCSESYKLTSHLALFPKYRRLLVKCSLSTGWVAMSIVWCKPKFDIVNGGKRQKVGVYHWNISPDYVRIFCTIRVLHIPSVSVMGCSQWSCLHPYSILIPITLTQTRFLPSSQCKNMHYLK